MQRHVVITGLAAAAQLINLRLAVAASSSSSAALSFVVNVHQPKTPTHHATRRRLHSTRLLSTSKQEQAVASASVCDVDLDSTTQLPDLVTKKGSAAILRKATLRNVDGDKVLLGERMGTDDADTSIIVFLRHLA